MEKWNLRTTVKLETRWGFLWNEGINGGRMRLFCDMQYDKFLFITCCTSVWNPLTLNSHTISTPTTSLKFAIKVIEKVQIQSAKQVARLQREIRFLKLLHHPHIVKVYDVIETAECIFIAMEHVSGGELFDYIVAHKRVKEKESRSMFRMVLSAVEYCHQVNQGRWEGLDITFRITHSISVLPPPIHSTRCIRTLSFIETWSRVK